MDLGKRIRSRADAENAESYSQMERERIQRDRLKREEEQDKKQYEEFLSRRYEELASSVGLDQWALELAKSLGVELEKKTRFEFESEPCYKLTFKFHTSAYFTVELKIISRTFMKFFKWESEVLEIMGYMFPEIIDVNELPDGPNLERALLRAYNNPRMSDSYYEPHYGELAH